MVSGDVAPLLETRRVPRPSSGVTHVTSGGVMFRRSAVSWGMTEHNTRHKVVVIGGGYAGTLAANHLRRFRVRSAVRKPKNLPRAGRAAGTRLVRAEQYSAGRAGGDHRPGEGGAHADRARHVER
jgi:hypothetical protein